MKFERFEIYCAGTEDCPHPRRVVDTFIVVRQGERIAAMAPHLHDLQMNGQRIHPDTSLERIEQWYDAHSAGLSRRHNLSCCSRVTHKRLGRIIADFARHGVSEVSLSALSAYIGSGRKAP